MRKRKAKRSGQNLICRQEKLCRQSEFEEDSSLKEKSFFFAIYQVQFIILSFINLTFLCTKCLRFSEYLL